MKTFNIDPEVLESTPYNPFDWGRLVWRLLGSPFTPNITVSGVLQRLGGNRPPDCLPVTDACLRSLYTFLGEVLQAKDPTYAKATTPPPQPQQLTQAQAVKLSAVLEWLRQLHTGLGVSLPGQLTPGDLSTLIATAAMIAAAK